MLEIKDITNEQWFYIAVIYALGYMRVWGIILILFAAIIYYTKNKQVAI